MRGGGVAGAEREGRGAAMSGRTRYSAVVKGSTGNWRRDVRFDVTNGYVGITAYEIGDAPIQRVLLTPKQFEALKAFVRRTP